MRNCIFFKLLAILLCAASLLGIIGGGAGILALTENDLYRKTVQEVKSQKTEVHAASFATQAAYRYADQVLGGCPEDISRTGYDNILDWNYTSYGYSILDGDGNVLESLNPELKRSTKTYTIPVTGQYMHLVSLQSESQKMEESAQKRLNAYSDVMTDIDGETVPPEGMPIHHVIFTGQDGRILYEASSDGAHGSSTYYYQDYLLDNGTVDNFANNYEHGNSCAGFLFYNPDRQLVYTSFLEECENPFQTTVYGVMFHSGSQGLTFQTENPEGIGTLSNESGYLVFTTFPEAQEDPVEETVPATTPETVPEETVTETQTVETVPETVPETEATVHAKETAAPEESDEEAAYSEETEEYYEESSASDVPEDPVEETWTETAYEEQPPEEPAEVPQETAPAETAPQQPTEPPVTENPDYSHLAESAQIRIFSEWLLSKGLIQPSDLPKDLISDEDLYNWLTYNGLTPAEKNADSQEEPLLINGLPLENYQVNQTEFHDSRTGELTTAKYVYLPMPELTVEVYLSTNNLKNAELYDVLNIVRHFRQYLLPLMGTCLVLFVLSAIYLCTAAGRRPKNPEIRAGGINRMPLDLYLALGGIIGTGALVLASDGPLSVPNLMSNDLSLGCSMAAGSVLLCCLLFVGYCFALVAQVKTGGGFWWRNTLSVRLIFLFMRYAEKLCGWLKGKALPFLPDFAKKLGQFSLKSLFWFHEHTQKLLFRIGKVMDRFFSLIPMTWQWMVCGIILLCLLLIACNTHSLLLILICLVAALGIILYGTHCFGLLLESTRKMGQGNLDTKVDKRLMIGCFWDFARELNNLADVANVAAQKQLKSERMKTELITNVSHDIKTPLTSIINYVDLLQKPHTAEDEAQYLEVLDRQSQRLKKLVDDLMDMSKASTGNMTMEITTVDMVESVNQALGEFSDKLDRAQLYPVFRHAEDCVPVIADGKLVWRVLSNLLSNVVKYAMPRTRIYLDLSRMNGKVILSLKNISKDPLNIDAEELMERFVRGDISRNTDGSGLGLNIAKSLMELQGGQLQMIVDGDLFKVTLIFPDGR